MVDIKIIPTTACHCRELGKTMREADKREAERLGGVPHRLLWKTWRGSLISKTVTIDGKVAAIFGVGGVAMGVNGSPWLITSPACELVSPLRFARIYQEEVMEMLKLFPVLANYVDNSYDSAVKLLSNIGFDLGEPEPLGKTGAMFRKFEMRQP